MEIDLGCGGGVSFLKVVKQSTKRGRGNGGSIYALSCAGVLIAVPTYACAHVEININLASQTDDGPFGIGRNLCLADLLRQSRSRDAERRFRPERCTPWSTPPNTTTPRCRTPFSSTANTRFMAPMRSATFVAARRRMAASASRRPMRRCCSPWCRAGGGNPHRGIAVQRYRAQREALRIGAWVRAGPPHADPQRMGA